MRFAGVRSWSGAVLTALTLQAAVAGSVSASDRRAVFFANGTTATVRINWNAFTARGFELSQSELEQALGDVLFRWRAGTGRNFRFVYGGTQTDDDCVPNGVLVTMGDSHADRLAGCYSCGATGYKVVLYREKDSGTQFKWSAWTQSGFFDPSSSLLHEFGHVLLGNDHSSVNAPYNVMSGYHYVRRFGPFLTDVERVTALYSAADSTSVLWRTTDQGSTWSFLSSAPANLNTTADVDAARDDGNLAVFYTNAENQDPCWILASDAGVFEADAWWCLGGQRSNYGTNGDGDDGEYMFTWAEMAADGRPAVKVVRATLAGLRSGTVAWASPPLSLTGGTPAVAKLGSNRWALAYSRLAAYDRTKHGQVVVRITDDDGASWSDEIVLSADYRAAGGVSLSSNQATDEIRVGFALAAYGSGETPSTWPAGTRTSYVVSATTTNGALSINGVYPRYGYGSRTAPGLARNYTAFHATFFSSAGSGWWTGRLSSGTAGWDSTAVSAAATSVTPALAADDAYNYVYMLAAY